MASASITLANATIESIIGAHPIFRILAEPCLFSLELLPQESPQFLSIQDSLAQDGLVLLRAHKVSNPITDAIYAARLNALKALRGKDSLNQTTAYHVVRSTQHIPAILQHGMRTHQNSTYKPLFGTGVYAAQAPAKANDYSPFLGNPDVSRFMLQLTVARGRAFEHPVGHFDSHAVAPPPGYDSVSGFVRRGNEFVLYDRTSVKLDFLLEYKAPDTARETSFPTADPPGVPPHHIAHITPALSKFFNELQARGKLAVPNVELPIKNLISDVLRKTIDADSFCSQIQALLKIATPSDDLFARLKIQLAKCRPPPPPAPAPAKAPAPTQASQDEAPSKKQKRDDHLSE